MQIPKNLPQFEKNPALFVTSGEYDAKFYIARSGILDLKKEIKMPPREEAREKQAFIGIKGGRYGLAAVSHRGTYIEDLKKKFQKRFHATVHDILAEFKLKEIYIFAPKYVAKRLEKGLSQPEKKDIRMEFYQEDTKINPLIMIKKFWQTEQSLVLPKTAPKNSARKILDRPKIK